MDSKVILKQKNPHDKANILSKAFLTWSTSLFRTGYKRDLVQDDLYEPRPSDLSGHLGEQLEKAWTIEVERAKKSGGKPSLSKALIRVFWLRYMLWGVVIGILYIFLWPAIPYTLGLFIAYFAGEKTEETYKWAHINNFLLNAFSVLTTILSAHCFLGQGIVGMQIRIASCSLMYRKLLKLDKKALSKTAPGQVINLMSNDVQRFDLVCATLHFLWVMPILVAVVSFLVWQSIEYATIAVLIVIAIQSVLVQGYLSKMQGTYRGKIAKRTDQRVRVMNELVNGVQVIKMYAWEEPFERIVAQLRKKEVGLIKKTSMIKGFSTALTVFTERFILFVAVVTFVAIGGDIRADITFSLVQYFNLLQLACNIFFPMALAFISEAKVSINRIEDFLSLDEITKESNALESSQQNGHVEKPKKLSPIYIENGYASWVQDAIVQTLRNIDVKIPPGQFLGIAGPVGSGKSSLLQVLIGELNLSKGAMSLGNARISYASQEPWLFVGSVRENILFGLEYDKIRYKKVITACALLRDFEQLPHADKTLVGERGISLSGGQRARIGLARAVYRQADVYMFDDPLSAVDTHVGKQLVNECFNGYLKRHTRILVTHQLHHLKSADSILVMRDGQIEVQGTFDEVSKNALFADLLEEDEDERTDVEKGMVRAARSRSMSTQSYTSLGSQNMDGVIPVEDLEDQEETAELMKKGTVSPKVYKNYFTAGAGWFLLILTLLSIILAQVVTSASDLWLTHWMNKVEANLPPSVSKANGSLKLDNLTRLDGALSDSLTVPDNSTRTEPLVGDDHDFYIYVWWSLILGCILITTERSLLFLWVCMRTSIGLHNTMFGHILRATMRFFDTNPSGRILNRFSKDMGVVDEILPRMMLDSLQIFMVMLGILIMVAIVNPYMLLTAIFCSVVMYLLTVVYLRTAQAIKRLETISRSPVFSHVTASMAGLSTVRTCNAQTMLLKHFDSKQDVHTSAWYMTLATNAAFSIWLSLTNALYVIIVAYTFLLSKSDTSSGDVGLAISQSLILVNMVQFGIKQATEVIAQMTSVERIMQYSKLPQEHPLESLPDKKPPPQWPEKPKIVFKDLYLRYEETAEPVLKNLNVVIESGWKVGVVGRTGAGKSSLIAALFRLTFIEGDIFIDNLNTRDIGLKDLRSKLSIIPQEPVLFTATLRYNLDPFDKHRDEEIWRALEQVELKGHIKSLAMEVDAGGSNFSAGQRQLLCLARAILSHNKVLVLDEATANVDPQTDSLIQKTIRTYFNDCTVVTVAHRLHTVADSDRVMVMEAGEIKQWGHPHLLLQEPSGLFVSMVAQLGQASENSLREIARRAYDAHIHYADAE